MIKGKTPEGAITFLDVLGWKGIWQRKTDAINDLLDIIELSKKYPEDIKKKHKEINGEYSYFDNIYVEVVSISDTIVLITEGDPESSLEFHANMCCKILIKSLEKGLPVRGATNYGTFNISDNIFVGHAIDEVASWYEAADWIGVIQTPSAYFNSINPCGNEFRMTEHSVPLKTKGNISTRCVDWPYEWIQNGKNELDLRDAFLKMGPITPELYPKFKNTYDFFKKREKDLEKNA